MIRAAIMAVSLVIAATSATAGPRVYPLALHDDRPFLRASVNGGTATEALLDSAAEMTLIDTGFARMHGIRLDRAQEVKGSGGSAQGAMASHVAIAAAGLTLTDRTVAILDLRDISKRLAGRPVTVILGREFFDAGRWTIDFRRGTITAVDRRREPPGIRLPLTTTHGIESFPIAIEGRAAQAAFDLGNGGGMLIGKRFADAGGLLTDGRPIGMARGGGIGGGVARQTLTLREVRIAGRRFGRVAATVDPLANAEAANVGPALLRAFRITVDYARHALWLAPVSAAPVSRLQR